MSISHAWQLKWREILGKSTTAMPDIKEDYTLHFDIWNVGNDKLTACFAIFLHGQRLLKRINEVRATQPKHNSLDDKKLLNKLALLNRNIEVTLYQFGNKESIELNAEKLSVAKRSVYRGNSAQQREVLKNADSLTIHLDDELCAVIEKYCGIEGYEAFHFLREPLYQLSGCNYTVLNWILWAMVEKEFDIDPYQVAFDLYKMKVQTGWSDNELFVFVEATD